jgi:hypothetical protein
VVGKLWCFDRKVGHFDAENKPVDRLNMSHSSSDGDLMNEASCDAKTIRTLSKFHAFLKYDYHVAGASVFNPFGTEV